MKPTKLMIAFAVKFARGCVKEAGIYRDYGYCVGFLRDVITRKAKAMRRIK